MSSTRKPPIRFPAPPAHPSSSGSPPQVAHQPHGHVSHQPVHHGQSQQPEKKSNLLFWLLFFLLIAPATIFGMTALGTVGGFGVYQATAPVHYDGSLRLSLQRYRQSDSGRNFDLQTDLLDTELHQQAADGVVTSLPEYDSTYVVGLYQTGMQIESRSGNPDNCEVVITTPERELTVSMVNHLSDEYEQLVRENKDDALDSQISDLAKKLETEEQKLRTAEAELRTMRQELGIQGGVQNGGGEIAVLESRIQSLQSMIDRATSSGGFTGGNPQSRLMLLAATLDRMSVELPEEIAAAMKYRASGGFGGGLGGGRGGRNPIPGQRDSLQRMRDSMVDRFGEDHPNVKRIDDRIREIDELAEANTNNVEPSEPPDFESLLADTIDLAESSLEEFKTQLHQLKSSADQGNSDRDAFQAKAKEVEILQVEVRNMRTRKINLDFQKNSPSVGLSVLRKQVDNEPDRRSPIPDLLTGAGSGFTVGLLGAIIGGIYFARRKKAASS